MEKIIYANFILWVLLKIFAPFKHVDISSDYVSLLTGTSSQILVIIPAMAFLAFVFTKYTKYKLQWLKLKTLAILGLAINTVLLGLTIYSEYGLAISFHGSLATLGLVIATSLAVAYRIKGDGVYSLSIGVLASVFVIGLYEIPYQVFRYIYYTHYVFNLNNLLYIILKQAIYVMFFAYTAYLAKIKITRKTVVIALGIIALWLIWIFPGHYWTIYPIGYIDGEYMRYYNEPINWPIYQIAKGIKGIMCVMVFSLDYKRMGA